jgi:hypothetical protein
MTLRHCDQGTWPRMVQCGEIRKLNDPIKPASDNHRSFRAIARGRCAKRGRKVRVEVQTLILLMSRFDSTRIHELADRG